MDQLIFSAPINSLSFGNVSYNFLKEIKKQNIHVHFFPIGKDLDFSAFDKVDEDFKSWIHDSYNNRYLNLSRDTPHLKMWHINGSETSVTNKRFLYTFHETSDPTETEINICNLQTKVFFSSSYSRDIFKNECDNADFIPIGFDDDFHKTEKKYLVNKTHFGLMGKFENRKHTKNIISYWVKRFGNNTDYQLTCCVNNPFMKDEDNHRLVLDAMGGEKFNNVNVLPRLKTNSEVNDFLNSIDVDLTGLSGAEGWNLPAFNATCLGKWSIVLNATAHKDWANSDNCILVEPSSEEDCYDEIFFKKGQPFNQGSIYNFTEEDFNTAIDKSLDKISTPNTNGEELISKFNYKNTVNQILNSINS